MDKNLTKDLPNFKPNKTPVKKTVKEVIYHIVGIVLSLIYLYSNDIKLSVYLHLAVNSTVLLLSYLAMAVPAGVYVAIECIVWLVVLGIGVYCCWILLRDRGVEIHQKTKEIRKIDKDISVGEIFSPAMIVVYVAILAATVIRYI